MASTEQSPEIGAVGVGTGRCGRSPDCTLPPHLDRDPCQPPDVSECAHGVPWQQFCGECMTGEQAEASAGLSEDERLSLGPAIGSFCVAPDAAIVRAVERILAARTQQATADHEAEDVLHLLDHHGAPPAESEAP